jgi:hypothetical protein
MIEKKERGGTWERDAFRRTKKSAKKRAAWLRERGFRVRITICIA